MLRQYPGTDLKVKAGLIEQILMVADHPHLLEFRDMRALSSLGSIWYIAPASLKQNACAAVVMLMENQKGIIFTISAP